MAWDATLTRCADQGNGVKLLMERAVPDGADNPKSKRHFGFQGIL